MRNKVLMLSLFSLFASACAVDGSVSDETGTTSHASHTGYVSVAWTLNIDGFPAGCDEAGAVEVAMTIDDETEYFLCDEWIAHSRHLEPGYYDIDIELLDYDGLTLSGPVLFDARFVGPGQITELEDILWDLESGGGWMDVSFSVDFFSQGTGSSNCALLDQGGEEVAFQEIDVIYLGENICESYTFVAETPSGDYVGTSCSEGIACVEPSVPQFLEAMPEGSYELLIRGVVDLGVDGYQTCYEGGTTFSLTNSGLDLGRLSVPLVDLPGC